MTFFLFHCARRDDSWLADDLRPVHSCCAIHTIENPGRPCLACDASRKVRRRH